MDQYDDSFDFGFSAVTEEELSTVQESVKQADAQSEKADRLYKSIQQLLDNLLKNPEKDYIYWPQRQEKIAEFKKHLDGIYLS